MIAIKSITRTTDACPTQWEGTFEDGDALYIRYRWGDLEIYKGGHGWNGEMIYDEELGGGFDGWLDDTTLILATVDLLEFPAEFMDGSAIRDRERRAAFDANIQRLSDHFRAGGTFADWIAGDVKDND